MNKRDGKMKRLVKVKIDPVADSDGNLWVTLIKEYIYDKNVRDKFTFRLMLHEFKELQIKVDSLIMREK